MPNDNSSPVHILIDLQSGLVEIEAPSESVGEVLGHLEEFLPALTDVYSQEENGEENDQPADTREVSPGQSTVEDGTDSQESSNSTTSKPSRSRKRRTESYDPSDLGLDASQREQFRGFFADKKPKNQNDKILAAMSWLNDTGKENQFSGSDITAAFQTVGERVPKKISAVFSKLTNEGQVKPLGDGKYAITPVGQDRVTHDLPAGSDS